METEGNQLLVDGEDYDYDGADDDVDDDSSNYVFLWLLIFSVMMFTMPFLAFYGTKEWLQNSFQIVGFPNNCYSALAAVIVIYIIIFMYAFLAFKEDCSKKSKKNV